MIRARPRHPRSIDAIFAANTIGCGRINAATNGRGSSINPDREATVALSGFD